MKEPLFQVQSMLAAAATAAALLCVLPGARAAAPAVAVGARGETAGGGQRLWAAHVQPLLESRCQKCHGGAKQKNNLDLRSPASALAGGDAGPAVVPGDAGASLLYQVLLPEADPHMPPKGDPLEASEIGLVRAWIEKWDEAPGDAGATGAEGTGPGRTPAGGPGGEPWPAGGAPPRTGGSAWLPPPGLSPHRVIDLMLEQAWRRDGLEPAGRCDDRTFVRRVYLDLAGRIPTPAEADRFLARTDSGKRAILVDELLEGPAHARHFAQVLDTSLLGREGNGRGNRSWAKRREHGWYRYLEFSVRTNRPWDQVALDLIRARPAEEAKEAGAAWFLYEKSGDAEAMAKAVAPALLGRQVNCAQCHDHPVAPEIEQRHFWGLVAFFKRTNNVDTPRGARVGESAVGGFEQFSNLSGESHDAGLVYFDGRAVEEARPAEGEKVADKPENYRVPPPPGWFKVNGDKDKKKKRRRPETKRAERAPVPLFSRRERLAQLAVSDPVFAEAFVNRAWALLMGRGFVHPVDKMDSTHPPSHPGLLRWLGRDFAQSGFDVRRLLREIVLSRAYQLSSVPPAGQPVPPPESFARGPEKPLPAEVLYRSLLVAAGRVPAEEDGRFAGEDEAAAGAAFARRFPDLFPEVYSPSVFQALFLTNNARFNGYLRAAGDAGDGAGEEKRNGEDAPGKDGADTSDPTTTAGRLLALEDDGERVREAFHTVLGRPPDDEEHARAVAFLEAHRERPADGVVGLLWALVAGAEFHFNH